MQATQTHRDATTDRAILRLFRAAIGHDPAHGVLRPLLGAHRAGKNLAALAHGLLNTPAGRALHGGPEGPADIAFTGRAIRAAAAGRPSPNALALAPLLTGRDRAAALATLAETPLFQDDAPDLPTLFADRRPDDAEAYRYWRRFHERLDPPARTSALHITIVIPVGDTTIEAALPTVDSLARQSHTAWRLLLVGTLRSQWAQHAFANLARHGNITIQPGNAWDMFRRCDGDLACLLAPGDRLSPHALGHVALAFEHPGISMAYTDEDVWDPPHGRTRPRFKTSPSPDAMQAGNAMGKLAVYRTAFLATLANPQDTTRSPAWELATQALQHDPAGLRHIPRVLLHAAGPPPNWPQQAWPRIAPPPTPNPMRVSIVIPTRDRPDLLRTVTNGVLSTTVPGPHELIILDHATTDPEALALLDQLRQDPKVQVIRVDGPFNFAAMNNRAAQAATGDVLLLLNNDIEVIEPGWLGEMAAHAMRPDVGAVGARLLARDGTLQHGGIALGPEGRATHLFRGAPRSDPGYDGMLAITRDVGAVTGACLAIRRDVWHRVGGMDESFPVTWNDIDLCQRVRHAGLRVIWTPHAVLTHLEGATRDSDARPDTNPRAHATFLADGARYRAIWGEAADIDPFLNPNLVATDYELCLAPPRL